MPPAKFNGEHGAIIEEIHKLALQIQDGQTIQRLNHITNVDKLAKLDDLNCKIHTERMAWHNKWLGGMTGVVGIVIGWIATLHFWK